MKITRVDIWNFMAIGYAAVPLSDRGLVLIQGDNKDETSADSNGAGKSSIADAISWALYGVTARGEDGDRVVNRLEGKDCWVKVTIVDDGVQYEISRYRKHKKWKNALRAVMFDAGGNEHDLTKGAEKLTQEVVNQILGCSHEVFVGSIYAGQERMPDLPGMSDKQLKMLIEEASGATLLEAAYEEAKTRVNIRKTEVDATRNLLDQAANSLADANKYLLAAEKGRDDFEKGRIGQARKLAEDAKASKEGMRILVDQLSTLDPKMVVEDQIKALDIKIAAVAVEQEELAKLDRAAGNTASDVAVNLSMVQGTEAEFTKLQESLKAVEHRVGCPCTTCARPMTTKEIAPAKQLILERLGECESELAKRKTALGLARSDAKSSADKRDAYRASMTDLSATNALRASLHTKLREIQSIEAGLRGHKSDLDLLVSLIKAKQAEPNPFLPQIDDAKRRIAENEGQARTYTLDLENEEKALKTQEAVAKVFSPSGVRAFLLDEVTPFLNDQTAKYLGTLSDGNIQATWTTLVKTAKGDLREKFSIEVTSVNGGETFKSISGGEKRKVRIACALALQDLVARRATKPIELFIGDEIDDALDGAGLERLTMILEEKAKERGSVFIISHSDLKHWIRNVITVRKSGGKAVIEEAVS